MGNWVKAGLIAGLVATLIGITLSPQAQGMIEGFSTDRLPMLVSAAGIYGPAAVIVLMATAIVVSPFPSAPIAIAAGAAYGHYLGTLYVAVGSELGALVAFGLARWLGRDFATRLAGDTLDRGLLGSQNALTLAVFSSRLLPFVSFDAVSYAAGLSKIHLWRFLIATLAGILPASFVLAHFGAAALDDGIGTAEWVAVGLGVVTAAPLIWMALTKGR